MTFWRRHPSDDRLAELARGELAGSARRRAVAHLRSCDRCAQRHERWVLLERTLAGGRAHEPSAGELSALREANRASVLAASRTGLPAKAPRWEGPRWLVPALSVAFVGVVGTLVVRQQRAVAPDQAPPTAHPEFAARGDPETGPEAALRVFCVHPGSTPSALADGQVCPAGATLAFAVRFEEPPDALVLQVHGGVTDVRFPIALQLEAGRETVLPHTVVLEGAGAREVVLTADERTLRQTVRLEAGP